MGPVLLLCNENSDLLDSNLGTFLSNTVIYDLMAIRHGLKSPETYMNGSLMLGHHRDIVLDFNTRYLFKGEIHAIREINHQQISTKHHK
eukprot:15338878-Ditylum_brightwellii.AAC.1